MSNDEIRMSNEMPNHSKVFNLEERTARFGEMVIDFAKKIPKNAITLPLIGQFVRAGTSVGANYCEADCAESKKDFIHKMGICRKESKESKYWVRMIVRAVPKLKDEARPIWTEANELNLIFSKIIKNTKARIQS